MSGLPTVRKWTSETLASEALKYTRRSDFQNGSKGAYLNAFRNGTLDSICSHMLAHGDRMSRHVYEIADHKKKIIYIGLSFNPSKRLKDHENNSDHLKKVFDGPLPMRVITREPIAAVIASKLENDLILFFKSLGYLVLNKVKGGNLGGSSAIWDRESCFKIASQYSSKQELRKGHPTIFKIIYQNKWMGALSHMTPRKASNGYWTMDRVQKEATRYSTRNDFRRLSSGAYDAAITMGILGEITSHMPRRAVNVSRDLFAPIRRGAVVPHDRRY